MKGLVEIENKKRMIEDYEELFSIRLARGEIIIAMNVNKEEPYLICDCKRETILDIEIFENGAVSNDYLEIIQELSKRISDRCELIETERAERGLPLQMLTSSDCISESQYMDFEGQVAVIKPQSLAAEFHSAEHQLVICDSGFGMRPDASGRAVYVTELYSGEQSGWNRSDIAGIIAPERMPEWAKEKLAVLQKNQEKKSVVEQIKEGQPTQEKPNKPKPKKDGPEH